MRELLEVINVSSILIASLSLVVAGVIGFWCRDVPKQIWTFIK